MANINLRGLDASTLSRIRASARRRKLSVNRLIVETLQEHYAKGSQRFDDLDDLAGAWSRAEAAAFGAAVAPFGEIDASLGRSPAPAARASTRSRARRTALDARRS
ncbi:MAG TPA: hypothetical protein VF959_01920 [Casimicrobiaceae bacterium]